MMKEKREFSPLMMLLAMLLMLCILFLYGLYGLVQSSEKEKAIQEKELALSNVELDYREILISEWNGRYRYAVSEQGDQIYISGISSGEDGYSDPGDSSGSSDLPGSSVQLESGDIFFHNNGNPIIPTNIFKNDENEGNYLIAVYISVINGTESVWEYFTNEPKEDRDALVDRVTSAQRTLVAKWKEKEKNY